MECTLHLECTWSGVGVYFYLWVIWPSPWSGILVYTYNIRSVVGVYTPVGAVTEWLWSVHSKLECTLRQGKGTYISQWPGSAFTKTYLFSLSWKANSLERPPNLVVALYMLHCNKNWNSDTALIADKDTHY